MDKDFWLERWQKNDIGFHKTEPHHYLLRFFDLLKADPGDGFFVPLCGKTPDLAWLRGRSLDVVGIDLSRLAVEAFVTENNLAGEWKIAAKMPCYLGRGYKLFCGDYFSLAPEDLGHLRAAFDRGSLVAMPVEMRSRYAQQLARLMPADSRVLMVSYAYDQVETYGPPFSVPLPEIETLFGEFFEVELLVEEDTLWSHKGLAARGVTELTEFAVLLTRL